MVNIRPQIFKLLKLSGKYERKHFSMKVPELLAELEIFNLKLDEQPHPTIKPNLTTTIQEPEISDDETEVQITPVNTPVIKTVKPKKVKQPVAQVKQPVVTLKRVTTVKSDDKKSVLNLIKSLSTVTLELLQDFDDYDEISDDDSQYINTQFDALLDKTYDKIDEILEKNEFDKPFIGLIEKKIKIIIDQKNKFLQN